MDNANFFLNKIVNGFWITIVFFCFQACNLDNEDIINTKINERVREFKTQKLLECRAKRLEDAEKIVDSLLLTQAISEVNDSLARVRPFRPVQPVAIPAIDSSPVKPLFSPSPFPASKIQ